MPHSQRDLLHTLERQGLKRDDDRLRYVMEQLLEDDTPMMFGEFEKIRKKWNLIDRALTNQLVLPDFEGFCGDVYEIYEDTKKDRSGANADYIPQLASVNPELYGVSVCTIDGQRYDCGDCDHFFCVQSCSKPITYMIAHEAYGEEKVRGKGVHRGHP